MEAKQKFNKLYINDQQKGVIYPEKYSFPWYQINFSLTKIYNNKRVYCSDILTSINTGKEINKEIKILNNFYEFYKLQLTKESIFINKLKIYNKKNARVINSWLKPYKSVQLLFYIFF